MRLYFFGSQVATYFNMWRNTLINIFKINTKDRKANWLADFWDLMDSRQTAS